MASYITRAGIQPRWSAYETRQLKLPKQFSLIDAPDLALEAIESFLAFHAGGAREVAVSQRHCTEIDLCAASVLNAIALLTVEERAMNISGRLPDAPDAKEIVLATGLPKALKLDVPEIANIDSIGLVQGSGERPRIGVASRKVRMADTVTTYLNKCLSKYDYALTKRGKDYFGRLLGEVLGNAEEHSGIGKWWVSSYLRQPVGAKVGDCHLVLFGFGRTLHQSLQELPPISTLRRQIEQLVHDHASKGYFRRQQWTAENLWTLYALQEGVTRYNDESGAVLGDRGQGTAEMIEAFQELGGSIQDGAEPRMAVVSGRTHILFDGRYRMQEDQSGSERRTIAFNEANDLTIPPDRKAVRTLQHHFPGVLISLRFYLDPEYLSAIQSPYATSRH